MQGSNPFTSFTLVELTALQTQAKQALVDVMTGGQSYTLAGRQFTRANINDLRNMLAEINDAIPLVRGTGKTFAQARTC